jgi:hypothetical protein
MWIRVFVVLIIAILILAASHVGIRSLFGRERPDIAAWVSFDDGLWAYKKTYTDGAAGPFYVGQSREAAKVALSDIQLFDEDRDLIFKPSANWRLALPARRGGYVIYTVKFDRDEVTSIQIYYAVFAGL